MSHFPIRNEFRKLLSSSVLIHAGSFSQPPPPPHPDSLPWVSFSLLQILLDSPQLLTSLLGLLDCDFHDTLWHTNIAQLSVGKKKNLYFSRSYALFTAQPSGLLICVLFALRYVISKQICCSLTSLLNQF